MIYTDLTKRAMKLCFAVHKDQTDKSGLPYVFHPFHLAEQMPVLEALKLLTHNPAVPYLDYVAELKDNPIARQVKLADLRHNSDLTRLGRVDDAARQRVKKYAAAIRLLEEA